MLKTTILQEDSIFKQQEGGDNKIDRFNVNRGKKITKKSRNFKNKKLCKPQKLTKSRKKQSKIGNLSKFNTKKTKPSFLIIDAKTAFNCLQLAFTKALILR